MLCEPEPKVGWFRYKLRIYDHLSWRTHYPKRSWKDMLQHALCNVQYRVRSSCISWRHSTNLIGRMCKFCHPDRLSWQAVDRKTGNEKMKIWTYTVRLYEHKNGKRLMQRVLLLWPYTPYFVRTYSFCGPAIFYPPPGPLKSNFKGKSRHFGHKQSCSSSCDVPKMWRARLWPLAKMRDLTPYP